MSLLNNPSDAQSSEAIFDKLVWLNTKDAAIYLRKTANAIRIAVCRGQLVPHKWRRRLYFKKSDLNRLLEISNMRGL